MKSGECEALGLGQGELWLIDVSQAVDLDHPRALDFLREVRPCLFVCALRASLCCQPTVHCNRHVFHGHSVICAHLYRVFY